MKEIHILDTNIFLKLYVNDLIDDDLSYEFEDLLSESEFHEFKEFVIKSYLSKRYFKASVNGEVKNVRFGLVSHSKSSESYIVRGPLVTKEYDEQNKKSRYQDNFNFNIINDYIKTKIINERLISLLVEKKIISQEEMNQIQQVSLEEILRTEFNFRTF
ncbi:hypothetical protein Q4O60_01715 [Aeribacillus pallidus]|nr:hypothetical protein [Aeribacillus pallidus]